MIINQGTMQDIFNNFNVIFNKRMDETQVDYPRIAMVVPSESSEETYTWFGQLPSMREWITGREIVNFAAHSYNIKNKDFELTVSIGRNDIEDDRIGLFAPMLQDLAEQAKRQPDNLVFSLLPIAFEEKCYDDEPFISDSHYLDAAEKKTKQSNKGIYKLSIESYQLARAQMLTIKGVDNKSLKIVPDLLLVSPQNEGLARQILFADTINGTTNVYKNTAELMVVPELADTPEMWFLLCTKKAVKPFVFQDRRKARLIAKNKDSDDNVFLDKEYIYGVDMRCNAGYGLWHLAFGSTGEKEYNGGAKG